MILDPNPSEIAYWRRRGLVMYSDLEISSGDLRAWPKMANVQAANSGLDGMCHPHPRLACPDLSSAVAAAWYKDKDNREAIAPFLTLAAGVAVAGVALMRHFAQTDADRQRRITESFSKAAEQLAHKEIEVRLGGIYTLEHIARESPGDHRTVMETLTAFVRERGRWEKRGPDMSGQESELSIRPQLPTDIAAVLTVIIRRPKKAQERENRESWRLDLSRADLRGATLSDAHLERADLAHAHLENSDLRGVHLEGAILNRAYLERADLSYAHLEGAPTCRCAS